ncbi:MAG: TRAP transporter large permease subunit [Pseudolabrys sp.]|nr:TRAP transporter large permease subunit [Pseudolabrys sp.]
MELLFLAILVLLMMAALGAGFPVAFALPGSAIIAVGLAALTGWLFFGNVDMFFTHDGPSQWLTAGVTNFRSVYWDPDRDTLIAIPLFVFMGIMLQRSRIAEDLLVTMAQLFGPVRGGLGMSVVFVGALLAATTGIVGATVVAMGLISLPAMLRNNYSHSIATGTIAASGTLGQIIPPSIVLIILADQLGSATDQASSARKLLYKATTGELQMPSAFDVSSTSAGEMFLGALVPGLLLVVVYIVFIAAIAFFRPQIAPAVHYDGKYDIRFAGRVVMALVPPLALIFIVLGSIIMGIATVNQAGAVGAVGAMVMAGYQLYQGKRGAYWPAIIALVSSVIIVFAVQSHPVNIKRLTGSDDVFWLVVSLIGVAGLLTGLLWSGWRTIKIDKTLQGVCIETAKTSSLVFIILMGAAMLTAAFRGFGGEELVKHFLTGLPGGFWGQFFTVMAVIFVLGFFLDFIEIAVVVVPIVAPILLTDPGANVTAVWLGVMIGVNMQTSFLTPPFGFALFYLRGVAPAIVKTVSMYKGVIPFILLQLLVLVIVATSPRLVNYLPQRVTLSAATAPPPINPGLQYCIEQYVADEFQANGSAIKAAIATARGLDLSALPEEMRKDLTDSFGKADGAFDLLGKVNAGEAAIDRFSVNYAPLHQSVREVQIGIRLLDAQIKELQTDIRRIPDDDNDARAVMQAQTEAVEAERKALQATIPAQWESQHKEFRQLLSADNRARLTYRRGVDQAYAPVNEAVRIINGAGALAALKTEIEALPGIINSQPMDKAAEAVAAVLSKINTIPGANSVRSEIAKVRRHLTGRTPDKDEALKALDKALPVYTAELAWRQKAAQAVLPGLRAYDAAIRDTIGLRKQEKLPQRIVPTIASCTSQHRDVSLQF